MLPQAISCLSSERYKNMTRDRNTLIIKLTGKTLSRAAAISSVYLSERRAKVRYRSEYATASANVIPSILVAILFSQTSYLLSIVNALKSTVSTVKLE